MEATYLQLNARVLFTGRSTVLEPESNPVDNSDHEFGSAAGHSAELRGGEMEKISYAAFVARLSSFFFSGFVNPAFAVIFKPSNRNHFDSGSSLKPMKSGKVAAIAAKPISIRKCVGKTWVRKE